MIRRNPADQNDFSCLWPDIDSEEEQVWVGTRIPLAKVLACEGLSIVRVSLKEGGTCDALDSSSF